MIVGVGIDLVAVERVQRMHERFGSRLARRVLARAEWPDYERCADAVRLLAKRFAAKEAAAKALGTGLAGGVGLRNLWVDHDPAGAPRLCWDGPARLRAEALGVTRGHLSLSDEREQVVACVILEN